ncbi:hypothetical protein SAMN05428970_2024 [Agromyces sp. CF514]|uniref:hypothetical protein n=1 Tax=Agromyces sp. CF514 TaxID=1881031 RepID=UPI0008E11D36|nr:hypothetical protein [Agromyces sp. CF514]SFR76172.1 hypothetical protein SAMN05428970_2024 [Agromyces sp. CF514]
MSRWFLADLRTGRQILDLPVMAGRWERLLNRPENIECTLDLNDPDVIALGARNTTATGKTVLAVAEGDVILAAGPIWVRSYGHDGTTMTLTAKGVWSYYDRRHILPPVAATVPLTDFTVPDPDESGKTMPNPALKTAYTGLELGTIAKRIVQQAHSWPGGALPIVFEADRAGIHERTYEGSDFKVVGDVLRQLQEVEGGPDVRFMPRFTADRLGIEWVLETGTQAEPLLASTVTHRWDVTATDSPVSNLNIDEDASDLVDLGWVTGGRSADEVLVSRLQSTHLTGLGYPLYEGMDSTRSSVVVQSTLDGHAGELVDTGSAPVETWSFDVETSVAPSVGSYFEGDYCELDIAPYGTHPYPSGGLALAESDYFAPDDGMTEVETDYYTTDGLTEVEPGYYSSGGETVRSNLAGDPYIREGGTFRHRIVAISGDAIGDVIRVQCAPRRSS